MSTSRTNHSVLPFRRRRSLVSLGAAALMLAAGAGGCRCQPPAGTDSGMPVLNQCNYSDLDSDGDGLPDTIEDLNGNGVVDLGECDPFNADTDSDGLTDSIEAGCDGLAKPGVDTRCDNPDTDGDGVADGFEDTNGNGVYEPGKGETDPVTADSDADGCDDGAEYGNGTSPTSGDSDGDLLPDGQEDFNCDGVIDPNQGETDPLLVDTNGNGVPDSMEPTFICVDPGKFGVGGRRPVDFHEQELGDWRIGIEAASTAEMRTVTYSELTIAGMTNPGDVRAGAVFDYDETTAAGPSQVAGFVLSLPTDTNFDYTPDTGMVDAVTARDRMINLIQTEFGTVSVRSLGNLTTSWEGFSTVVGIIVEIGGTGGGNVGAARHSLLPALMAYPASNFTNLPTSFGSATSSMVIAFQVLYRAQPQSLINFPGRVMVMGAVVDRTAYDDTDLPTAIRAGDLSNGTGLAQWGDSDANECDPFDLVQLPVADIIWVIDDSGSTDPYRTSMKDNAVDLFDRATAAGLDFRMGVTSYGPTGYGTICDPPVGAAVPGAGVSCSSATPVPPLYNPQASSGRWLSPLERDAYGWCVCHPPNGDGGIEYGLEKARAATMSGLPRNAGNPRMVRPNATLVVIFVGDEDDQAPGYEAFPPVLPGTADWTNHVQPFIDLWSGVANPINMYPVGATPDMGIARVHAITTVGSCGIVGGYPEVVTALGGQLGEICAGSLGPTLQLIIDDIIGSASPVTLDRTPISLSLACALGPDALDRSRVLGFDYNAAANSVIFFGLGAMLEDADVACSYKYPVDDSPYEEGSVGAPLG
jgi:hypothetical protein